MNRTLRSLPADAIVGFVLRKLVGYSNEVDDNLVAADPFGDGAKLGVTVADHDCVRVRQHLIDLLNHEAGDVGYVVQDIVPVGASQTGQADVAIE